MVDDDTALDQDELLVEVRFHMPPRATGGEGADGEPDAAEAGGFVERIKQSGDLEVAGASLLNPGGPAGAGAARPLRRGALRQVHEAARQDERLQGAVHERGEPLPPAEARRRQHGAHRLSWSTRCGRARRRTRTLSSSCRATTRSRRR